MSAPAYDDYKESGIEWLGQVPRHWSLAKLRYLADFVGGGTPSRDKPEFWGGDVPWVSPKDMKTELILGAQENITEEGLAGSSSSLIEPGAVLMVVRSGILQHTIPVAQNAVPVALNQDMKALRFNKECSPAFFVRWVQGLNNQLLLAWAKQGATVESIEHAYLADSIVPLPPSAEQADIAAFLDRETGKIDALVEAQTRLIELLKEKRQAVISHAVTKGLDPAAPMKDSGVEWLGQVPAHWEVRRFAAACTIAEGLVDPKAEPYASMVLIAPNHVASATGELMALETAAEQGAESGKYRVQEGDIVYSKIRPALAKVVVSPCDGLCSADMYPLRSRADTDPHFLKWVLLSPGFTAWAVLESERVAMPKINREKLNELRLPVPPHAEQASIAAHVNEQTKAFDTLAREADAAIALLQERRAALISAAVTGKIDVRGLAPAQAEAA